MQARLLGSGHGDRRITDYLLDRRAEYSFQVQANRIEHYQFNTAQLKTIQEVITLVVFCIFSVLYLKEGFKWNHLVGFAMMIGAVFVIFKEW